MLRCIAELRHVQSGGICHPGDYDPMASPPAGRDITNKNFRPGQMAPSECMCSVGAVRVTPAAEYSAPGLNTTRRVAYHSLIGVSPFFLALLVFYCKQTLLHCGHLWRYVGMGSLGTRLHRDSMQLVTLWTSLLAFLLPVGTIQFSVYQLYTSFQVTRSMWLLTIHCWFRPSPVLLLVTISGNTCAQPRMFPTLKTGKATAACASLTCTNFETGPKLTEFPGIIVGARVNQCSTKAPALFWSLSWIVVSVAMGDPHPGHHNTSPVALATIPN